MTVLTELRSDAAEARLRSTRRLERVSTSGPIVLSGTIDGVAITDSWIDGIGLERSWFRRGSFTGWTVTDSKVQRFVVRQARVHDLAISRTAIGEMYVSDHDARGWRLSDVVVDDLLTQGGALRSVEIGGELKRVRLLQTSMEDFTIRGEVSDCTCFDTGGSSGDWTGMRGSQISIFRPASPGLRLPCVESTFLVRFDEAKNKLLTSRELEAVGRSERLSWPDDALISIGHIVDDLPNHHAAAARELLWPLRRETAG